MKRKLLVAIPLLCLVGVLAWFMRPKHETYGEGFISERSVTLWSGVAQVREPLDTLYFGDRVEIVARHNDNAKVRTAGGTVGWIDARMFMDSALWKRSAALLDQAQALPVQARGRTKVATNLRVQPGRAQPRLYQFGRGIPVEIVGRAVADAAPPAQAAQATPADEKEKEPPPPAPAEPGAETKKEEWLFIRALATRPPGEANVKIADPNTTTRPGDQTIPIAGWIVGRFVELDLPDTVKEGTSSANVRPVAWFELTKVTDPSGLKPEYLVAGARGPDSQPCDFTILRVYTWNPRKTRYETAFIENNLCGQLPIRVGKSPKSEPEFRFRTKDEPNQDRVYRLMQTVVRRIREDGSVKSPPKKSGSKSAKPAKSAAKAKTKKKS
jgi:hypothetical protein